MLQYLLDEGANPSMLDYQGVSPLQLAVANEHAAVVEKLLKTESDTDSEDLASAIQIASQVNNVSRGAS